MTTDAVSNDTAPRIGFLGTGLMGSAMAHRLIDEQFAVIAWDRDSAHVEALTECGGQAAGSPSDVVRAADIVITMLPTADIVLSVVDPLLSDWPPSTIWLQMSSVGAKESDRLSQAAASNDVTIVDAPVSGSTHPAEEGRLTVLASGPDSARQHVEPVLDALASRVQWVGEVGAGSRLKLAANHWMIGMVAVLAESMHLCELMGLDQREFLVLLDGGPLGSAYAVEKIGEMRDHSYPAGFPVRLAVKDLELAREVPDSSHVDLPLLDAVLERVTDAMESHADDDLAAVYELAPATRN
jgi:3-hydroxyisobutyrate dehydrogenase